MRNRPWLISLFILMVVSATAFAAAEPRNEPIGAMGGTPNAIDWSVGVDHAKLVLSVTAPDGEVLTMEFPSGNRATVRLQDLGKVPQEGTYRYELRLIPRVSAAAEAKLKAARASGDEKAAARAQKEAGLDKSLVQSGAFTVANGAFVSPNLEETTAGLGRSQGTTDASTETGSGSVGSGSSNKPWRQVVEDQVIPDDLIVQGSACVGLDCVNNESFGFDTIRMKENNTRVKFEDTSVGSFPTNDWQLTANDSASGASSKFSIEDITGSKVPFTVTAGAATNSIFVDSTGRVGFRTSTPVLDLHVNTSNTPALRLEQNNSGGFTAQTWDIAGNEANFFVRDVTGGSRLPFRIRPGAPTSSVDISADGDTGVGTASPEAKLHVFGANTADTFIGLGANPDGTPGTESALTIGYAGSSFGRGAGFINTRPDSGATAPNPSLRLAANNVVRMLIDNEGHIGLGDIASGGSNPDAPFHYTNGAVTARLTTAGAWQDNSSRATKEHITDLSPDDALKALRELTPVTYTSRVEPNDPRVGFIAEDVPDLVAVPKRDGLIPLDIVAVVTKVVQEQQKTIEQLNERIAQLEKEKNQ